MKTKTDAKSTTIAYEYDAVNRLTKIDFPTDTDIIYTYDTCPNGKGRLCAMTDQSGAASYEYTAKGQIAKETKLIDGITYVTQYSYDMNGNLKTITYPSRRVITYNYNYSNDRAVSVLNNAANLASNINYKSFGGVASLTYGNGVIGSITYDNQYRISGIQTGTIQNLSYTFDTNGNITGITNNLDTTKNKTFTYDALDRLAGATGLWGNLNWTYDGVGNRQTQIDNAGTATYSYTANKLTAVSGTESRGFAYDNNGNTATEDTRQYTYNQNQRLIKAIDNGAVLGEYTYNGNGQRVKKTTDSGTVIFHYNLQGQLITESNSTGQITAEYVYLNGAPLAKAEGANTYYYHNDHLGTPQRMTDGNGQVVWEGEYKPFGEVSTTGTVTNNIRFPGQYFDAETGLNYNYFRDYNPVIGRYIEADPIGIQEGTNHIFVYVDSDPINKIDPLGWLSYQKGVTEPNDDVIKKLKCIEKELGQGADLSIGSGKRANDKGSAHETGYAADISTKYGSLLGKSACDIVTTAKKCGFKRAYQNIKTDHVHVDTDPNNKGGEAGGGGWKDYKDPCQTPCKK